MSLNGIQPLDLQTEHLDHGQYPSLRFLLVVAAIVSSLLILSWASHRDDFAAGNQDRVAAADGTRIDRDLISRAFPLRP